MHYSDRNKANEVLGVQARMVEVWKKNGYAAHDTLVEWGVILRKKFDADNLHLVSREGAGTTDRIVTVLSSLHNEVTSLNGQVQKDSPNLNLTPDSNCCQL